MVEIGDTAYSDGVSSEAAPPESGPAAGLPSGGASSLLGQTLGGRYRVTSLIGSGGMGAVYRAEHLQLQKTVALKVLNAEMAAHREAALRFEREAMVSARIQHPNVVNATDSGRLPDGSLYLVLEYVAGSSLRQLLDREQRLPTARALAIGAQIADALSAAHAGDVVHRDLKPGNVMLLSHDGDPEFVKVLDFGLARVVGSDEVGEPLTRSGSVFGTPEYMSPEQARGEVVDHRADLYALGVILYELLCGRPPFQAPELVAVLIKHIQEPPPPLPPDIPASVAEYVLSLLDKAPARRPATARQVAKALRRLAPPPPTFSTVPPRASATTLDRGGVRPPRAGVLGRFGQRLMRLEWPDSLRHSGRWLRRLSLLLPGPNRGGVAPLRLRFAQLLRHAWQGRWSQGLRRRFGAIPWPWRLWLAGLALLGLIWLAWPAGVAPDVEPAIAADAAAGAAPLPRVDRSGRAALTQITGHFRAGRWAEGLDALSRSLKDDPELAAQPEVLSGVRRAVDDPATRDRALTFAATELGSYAADLLFDVWAATGAKTPATRGARKWLDTEQVRKVAPAPVLLALQIREVKGCSAALSLLPRVTELADQRSLVPLRRFQSGSGCGFLGLEDCYGCLRKGDALDQAIRAVTERPAPTF
jgi:serine/threonine-protein kinase